MAVKIVEDHWLEELFIRFLEIDELGFALGVLAPKNHLNPSRIAVVFPIEDPAFREVIFHAQPN